jgi:acetylornithine deacetylase/succinyl-diaminopimelate desuccinylase-like protein
MVDANGHEMRGQATELLQALIRNECVNDGTPESGEEVRNADLLAGYLEGGEVTVERFAPIAGRSSVVARIEGSDPTAPALCLMGHTDVVPVSPSGWSRDPFGGELVRNTDGVDEVWGRGAIDMLNMTSTMAVAFKRLASQGWRPRGTLIYFGVADEEAGGTYGARWMVDEHWDAVGAEYVLTEMGGWPLGDHDPRRVWVTAAEKGIGWRQLRVRGTPGHGSMPHGADNALVTAAEVVRRLTEHRPTAAIGEHWRNWVETADVPDEVRADLLDPERIWSGLETLPPKTAARCHAMTHTTISPNVADGGQKTNTIPDAVDLDLDIRTLPGVTDDDVDLMLREILGDLADRVEVSVHGPTRPSSSTPAGNPLWDALTDATQVAYPGAVLVPGLTSGGTDSPFFRARGSIAYGAGIFSESVTHEKFASRFHGHDERIDVESLGLCADFWTHIAHHICD